MDYKTIGRRVQYKRKSLNLTQDQLSEKAGISLSFLGHIERGTRKMSVQTLALLAVHLKCSADYLIGISEIPKSVYERALEDIRDMIDTKLEALDNPQPAEPIHNQDFT